MATSAASFQPTTDRYGDLTLHTGPFGRRVTGMGIPLSARARQAVIAVGFLAVFGLTLSGLFVADRAIYAEHDAPVTYSGYVDYD